MERTSKLAQLTLVSKYYPVANYSYPRSEGARTPYNSRRSSNESEDKRTSLGSQASAGAVPLSPPGLIDDRTDSEASADDDDYRYHAHGDELWDSFLESGLHIHGSIKNKDVAMASVAVLGAVPPMVPPKDYPALIPSPRYSVAKNIANILGIPQDCVNAIQHMLKAELQLSALSCLLNGRLLSSSIRSSSSSKTCRPSTAFSEPSSQGLLPGLLHGISSPYQLQRLTAIHPLDYHYPPPSPPPTAPLPALPPLANRSPHSSLITPRSSNLISVEPALTQTLRPYKSTTQLRPKPPPEPLPISVFEYDTDSDCDNDDNESSSSGSPTLPFFRFHRRSQSPNTTEGILARRRGSASKAPVQQSFVDAATVAKDRRRRKRTNTMESLKQSVLGLRSR
ncbi:hypothetical protein TrVFT333_008979 [Trichoderma virens FT-333]|nr:hypothetical protein TrVFT333_008979 [Trichoderma virens FT-333]